MPWMFRLFKNLIVSFELFSSPQQKQIRPRLVAKFSCNNNEKCKWIDKSLCLMEHFYIVLMVFYLPDLYHAINRSCVQRCPIALVNSHGKRHFQLYRHVDHGTSHNDLIFLVTKTWPDRDFVSIEASYKCRDQNMKIQHDDCPPSLAPHPKCNRGINWDSYWPDPLHVDHHEIPVNNKWCI